MALHKCPRCELNYIPENEKLCNVCKRELKSGRDADEQDDTIVMCIECGDAPAVKGSELCVACLREARRQEKLVKLTDPPDRAASLDLGDVELDDMEVPIPPDDDIPESELEVIEQELGDGEEEEDDESESSENDEPDDLD